MPDWDETDAAHNYDSEDEPGIVYRDLDSHPVDVDWDEEVDGEGEDDPAPSHYAGAQMQGKMAPLGTVHEVPDATGGAWGSLFYNPQVV